MTSKDDNRPSNEAPDDLDARARELARRVMEKPPEKQAWRKRPQQTSKKLQASENNSDNTDV